jgi:hypothetical protein
LTDGRDYIPNARDYPFTETGGPCSTGWLTEVFANPDMLRGKLNPPSDAGVTILARSLNTTLWIYNEGVGLAKRNRERAEEVLKSIKTLDEFFEERARQCFRPDGKPISQGVLEIERGLYVKYSDFREALGETSGALEMDSTAVMPPRKEGWQEVAPEISAAFTQAMSLTNGKEIGFSERGPRARFVRAVLQQMGMIGNNTTVEAVRKALVDASKGIQRDHRKPKLQIVTST